MIDTAFKTLRKYHNSAADSRDYELGCVWRPQLRA